LKVFLTADTHFGHDSLHSKFKSRPKDFEDRIIDACKRIISSGDLVIFLGDVVVGKSHNWSMKFSQIPGKKILVMGNHDDNSYNWYMKNGFDFVCDQFQWEKFGLKIAFSHHPLEKGDFDLNVHGHIHIGGRHDYQKEDHHFLLSIEENGYQPYKLESIVKKWRRSQENIEDV
jgi:calcineurin-like phosphoesterase family protein